MFYRYVDNCIAVFPNCVSALKFHHDLTQFTMMFRLTYELKSNKQLAFLGVGLTILPNA